MNEEKRRKVEKNGSSNMSLHLSALQLNYNEEKMDSLVMAPPEESIIAVCVCGAEVGQSNRHIAVIYSFEVKKRKTEREKVFLCLTLHQISE